ncbi:MAG: acyltransferase family protein [Acetivibrio sp.]
MKERDIQFDNFRAILILLVVVTHFMEPLAKEIPIMEYFRKLIFTFHMPAFVFISGYFSKKNDFWKLVKRLLIPYGIMQVVFYLFGTFLWGTDPSFSIIKPVFSMWFLLALFVWRCSIGHLSQLKGLLFFAFLAGLLAGILPEIGKNFSLSRILVFFPYFVLGYRFDKEKFMKKADRTGTKIAAIVFFLCVGISMKFLYSGMDLRLVKCDSSYQRMHLVNGWIDRGILYLAAIGIICTLILWMPKKKHFYTYMGSRTMGIYMVHGLCFKTILNCTNWYTFFNTKSGAVMLLFLSIGICFLLSTSVVNKMAGLLFSFPIEKMLKQE